MNKIEKGDMVECIDDSCYGNGRPLHSGVILGRRYVVYDIKDSCHYPVIDIGLTMPYGYTQHCNICDSKVSSAGETYWCKASRFRKIEPSYKLVEIETSIKEELKKFNVTEKIDA